MEHRDRHWHWPWTHCHHIEAAEEVRSALHHMTGKVEALMATVDDLQTAVTELGEAAQAAADRVIASLDAASATIADLQAQIEALIAANANDITPEQLQAVADGLVTVKSQIDGIDPSL